MTEVLLQITSGRGPVECACLVAGLDEAILADGRFAGLETEIIEKEDGPENGTFLSALMHLSGDGYDVFAPDTREPFSGSANPPSGPAIGARTGSWGSGGCRFPQPSRFGTRMRGSRPCTPPGPGGQHVNTMDSAVRAVHLPTGLTAVIQDEISRMANRKRALERLSILAAHHEQRKLDAARQSRRDAHNELVRGNPVRGYTGPAFTLVRS